MGPRARAEAATKRECVPVPTVPVPVPLLQGTLMSVQNMQEDPLGVLWMPLLPCEETDATDAVGKEEKGLLPASAPRVSLASCSMWPSHVGKCRSSPLIKPLVFPDLRCCSDNRKGMIMLLLCLSLSATRTWVTRERQPDMPSCDRRDPAVAVLTGKQLVALPPRWSLSFGHLSDVQVLFLMPLIANL